MARKQAEEQAAATRGDDNKPIEINNNSKFEQNINR